jgi:para-nitrobenzyl esterase
VKVAQHAAPVFMYQLAYRNPTVVPGTDFPIGSPHASDINLKFANTDKNLDSFLYADQSPGRLATARHMSALWAGFARYGHPDAAHVRRWPAYTRRTRATMWIDADGAIVNDPDREERLFWQNNA